MKSNSSKDRRLSVVLFADIEGYTALMQADEEQALEYIQKYQAAFKQGLELHDGNLVKNMGDGCICSFYSTRSAVLCAKFVQNEVNNQNTSIPLRIGIHLGDVTFQDNDIYGSAVNIASRIESLCIAGGILLSSDVYHKVQNQNEFEFQSLGEFELKNVDRAIEIYALANQGLAIPNRKELLRKNNLKRSRYNVKIIGALIAVLITVLGWHFLSPDNNNESNSTERSIPKDINLQNLTDYNVAVMVFNDQTNNPDFKSMGLMLSDWITQGIFQINRGNVISASTIRSGYNSGASESLSSFASDIGADVIVNGNYYILDNIITISGSIINPHTGSVIQALPQISGSKDNLMKLINNFSANVLGFWSTTGSQYFDVKIPNYDAYKLSLEGETVWMSDFAKANQHFLQSYAADSTYATPLLRLIKLYANADLTDQANKIIELINKKNFKLSELGQLELQSATANINSNKIVEVAINEQIAEISPANAYMAGLNNLELNRLDRAVDYFKISIENNTYYDDAYSQWNYAQLSHTYVRQGMFQKCIELYESMDFERKSSLAQPSYLISLSELGRWDEIENVLDTYIADSRTSAFNRLNGLLSYLYTRGKFDIVDTYIDKIQLTEEEEALALKKYFGPFTLGSHEYMKGNFEKAAFYYGKERYQGIRLYELACLVKADKLEEAEKLKNEIIQIDDKHDQPYIPYVLAQYHLVKGDTNKALELLKEAKGSQMPFLFWSYDFDVILGELNNNEKFNQIILPKTI